MLQAEMPLLAETLVLALIEFFLALESYSELVLEGTLLLKQIWTDAELRQQLGDVFFCPCRGKCTA